MGFDNTFSGLDPWQMFILFNCQRLNDIQDPEYVVLIASLKYTLEKRYNCNSPSSYLRQGRMPDQSRIDQARGVRGCYKPITDPTQYHRHSNIVFKRCVCNYYDSQINTLIDLSEYYKINKTLPKDYIYETGVISSKMAMALRIVDGFIEEKRAEEIKKQTDAVKMGQRGRK